MNLTYTDNGWTDCSTCNGGKSCVRKNIQKTKERKRLTCLDPWGHLMLKVWQSSIITTFSCVVLLFPSWKTHKSMALGLWEVSKESFVRWRLEGHSTGTSQASQGQSHYTEETSATGGPTLFGEYLHFTK